MSAETDLYAALDADVPLAALVGEQIFPDFIPQERDYPAVVYQRVGTDPVQTIHGTQVAEFANLEVACVAKTRAQAEAIGDAAETALLSSEFIVDERSSGYDPQADVHLVTIQVRIFAVP